MIVHVTQYRGLATIDGVKAPIGTVRLGRQGRSTAGAFTALDADCNIIRVVTDTAIHFDRAGSADTNSELVLSEAWFETVGGEEPDFIAA